LNEKCGWIAIKESGYNIGLVVGRQIGIVELGK
jgi:hypothetical protein